MTNEVFVDTSAWVATSDSSERHHIAAKGVYMELLSSYRLITTNLVISETYILLRKGLGDAAALKFLRLVRSSPRIEIVRSTEELEVAAEAILWKYREHPFSYTDAVSFTLMKNRNISKAFAFDRHFKTAGFQVVPVTSN